MEETAPVKELRTESKTYRPSVLSFAGAICFCGLLLIVFLLVLFHIVIALQTGIALSDLTKDIAVLLSLMGLAVFILVTIISRRLVVSQTGIEYHSLRLRFFTRWENIIEVKSWCFKKPMYLLVLKQPAQLVSKPNLFSRQPLTELILDGYNSQVRDGDLHEDIARYAPHVKFNL